MNTRFIVLFAVILGAGGLRSARAQDDTTPPDQSSSDVSSSGTATSPATGDVGGGGATTGGGAGATIGGGAGTSLGGAGTGVGATGGNGTENAKGTSGVTSTGGALSAAATHILAQAEHPAGGACPNGAVFSPADAPPKDPAHPTKDLKQGMDLDLHQAVILDNPGDLADWPETTRITQLMLTSTNVIPQFSKRDGDGRWPDELFTFPPDGALEYTMGFAEYIGGQWYASAPVQIWAGLAASGGGGGGAPDVYQNWYYGSWWGPMRCRQPAPGELVGFFVVAGDTRHVTVDDGHSPVKERSNVILFKWPDDGVGNFNFQ